MDATEDASGLAGNTDAAENDGEQEEGEEYDPELQDNVNESDMQADINFQNHFKWNDPKRGRGTQSHPLYSMKQKFDFLNKTTPIV